MGGKLVDAPADGDLDALDPAAVSRCEGRSARRRPKSRATGRSTRVRAPAELDDVDVGVVRAVFGVAETGSVWLTEAEFKVNTLGFLSQHLVVLLDPARIVGNMHHAYRERAQFDARYGVFMTGPSATADIEGRADPRRPGHPQPDGRPGRRRDDAVAATGRQYLPCCL